VVLTGADRFERFDGVSLEALRGAPPGSRSSRAARFPWCASGLVTVERQADCSAPTPKEREVVDAFSFLFMKASGQQLAEIASLIDSGVIHPVVDRVFPFESTKEAYLYRLGTASGSS